jgi:hypothetical protein
MNTIELPTRVVNYSPKNHYLVVCGTCALIILSNFLPVGSDDPSIKRAEKPKIELPTSSTTPTTEAKLEISPLR